MNSISIPPLDLNQKVIINFFFKYDIYLISGKSTFLNELIFFKFNILIFFSFQISCEPTIKTKVIEFFSVDNIFWYIKKIMTKLFELNSD